MTEPTTPAATLGTVRADVVLRPWQLAVVEHLKRMPPKCSLRLIEGRWTGKRLAILARHCRKLAAELQHNTPERARCKASPGYAGSTTGGQHADR